MQPSAAVQQTADSSASLVGTGKDSNVGPLSLSKITASDWARRKTHSGKQNEFSRSRSTINFG
jgi:hypothetical protein